MRILLVLAAALVAVPGVLRAQDADSARAERAARATLAALAGDWRFEWRSGDGRARARTGTRSYRLRADSLQVTWEESYDDTPQQGHGVLRYHPGVQRYFLFGLYAPDGSAVLLEGQPDVSRGDILFRLVPVPDAAVPINEGMVESRLRLLADGGHRWSRWDDGWVVTFRRR